MNEAKKILDGWLLERNFKTYKELADFLGVAQNTLDVWKQRGKVPEKNILKYIHLTSNTNSAVAIGSQNIAINGDNNTLNHQNDITNTPKFKEFLELFKSYGNEKALNDFITKLNNIKEALDK
ncbi:helix-turn-helix domain-containing protein [Campylobacter gastrosuis]|uniref:Helix-turn-helix domain containing protein n=1 Tax=Campylobacter gastrosuis TaxID=2974576 RepID=A0ABT7HSN9_9BACT|nr:helix-turn-helix domain-containing protein [Campylobacter gastrosuis]MDL0089922.1 helix-turn-helix domain containing protein [Campylobacter gastrosuis]